MIKSTSRIMAMTRSITLVSFFMLSFLGRLKANDMAS